MKTITRINEKELPGRFADLVVFMPPHVIRNDGDYENVAEIIDALLRLRRPTKGQQQYLETLSVLVAAYDDEHHGADLSGREPVEVLQYLLEANDMNASALGELLGNRALGSKILRGVRELSKAHIRTLADRFKVEPRLFL